MSKYQNDVIQAINEAAKRHGWTREGTAALLGMTKYESSYNPYTIGDYGRSFGIFQVANTFGTARGKESRQDRFVSILKQKTGLSDPLQYIRDVKSGKTKPDPKLTRAIIDSSIEHFVFNDVDAKINTANVQKALKSTNVEDASAHLARATRFAEWNRMGKNSPNYRKRIEQSQKHLADVDSYASDPNQPSGQPEQQPGQQQTEVERIPEEERKKLQSILDKNPNITIDQAKAAVDAGAAYGVSRERMVELLVKGDPEIEKLIPPSPAQTQPGQQSAQSQQQTQPGQQQPSASGFLPMFHQQGLAGPNQNMQPTSIVGMARAGGTRYHAGADYYAPPGEPLLAQAKGKVVYIGAHNEYGSGNYGRTVVVQYDNGYTVQYSHLAPKSTDNFVKVGDTVNPGQQIAITGASGTEWGKAIYDGRRPPSSATPPHAHVEVTPNDVYNKAYGNKGGLIGGTNSKIPRKFHLQPTDVFQMGKYVTDPELKKQYETETGKKATSNLGYQQWETEEFRNWKSNRVTVVQQAPDAKLTQTTVPVAATSAQTQSQTPGTTKSDGPLPNVRSSDLFAQQLIQRASVDTVLNRAVIDSAQDGPGTTPPPPAPTLPATSAAISAVNVAGPVADMIPPPSPSTVAGPGGEMMGGPESTSVSSEDLTRTREAAATQRGREILGQRQATQAAQTDGGGGAGGGTGPSSTPSQNNTDYSPPSPGSTGQSHSDESLCWV